MADHNSFYCPTTFPRIRGNSKRTHETSATRSTVYKGARRDRTIHTSIPKAKDVYIKIYNAFKTMHTNQTGHFPATSSRGNQYVMVLIEVDGNFIDGEPMKNIRRSNDKSISGTLDKTYLIGNHKTNDTHS